MQRFGLHAFRPPDFRRPLATFAATLLLLAVSAVSAQTTPQPAPQSSVAPAPYTLHVYANLIQIPTLVLTRKLQPISPIPVGRFDLSLDSGPSFHPTRMRREGDDPLALAILIDDSRDPFNTLPALGDALSTLAPQFLHPQDHVSIFALDCSLVRSLIDATAGPAKLQQGVAAALATSALHGNKSKPACRNSLHLWDSVAYVTSILSGLPGWRVLLVLSTGNDTGSVNKWATIQQYAATNGVAVFGLRDSLLFSLDYGSAALYAHGIPGFYQPSASNSEDLFELLCANTGGLLLTRPVAELRSNLEDILTMLRGRYILQFPRPDTSQPGLHNMAVTIPGNDLFISGTGVSVPLPDPRIQADPTTVPSAPSPAVLGHRRPITPDP